MIYIEELEFYEGFSFVSGDDRGEMIIFLNIVKAMGLMMSGPNDSPNIVMMYGDVKKAVEIMSAVDEVKVEYVNPEVGRLWSRLIKETYQTNLLSWGDL